MSSTGLLEVYTLQEIRNIEIISDMSTNEKLEIKVHFTDGWLMVKILEEYPQIRPIFHPQFSELDNTVIATLLNCSADLLIGGQMLDNLINELENSILPDLRENRLQSEEKKKIVEDLNISKLYREDKEPVSTHTNKRGHQNKSNDLNQKPSKSKMKTAIDVIHRIQWDNSLNSDDFIVGYIDRFRGILEKPFSDFAWKDMAEIDYIEDFGVPQHRIQYFKWNNIIVWNKEARIDYIFGSAEGNGKKITDIIADACT